MGSARAVDGRSGDRRRARGVPGRRRLRRHGRPAARRAPPPRAGLRRAPHHRADPRPHGGSRRSTRPRRVTETGGIFALDGGRPGAHRGAAGRHRRAAGTGGPGASRPLRGRGPHARLRSRRARRLALLGAASVLASRREDLPGRYLFLFQPGEEALCGAKTMVEGGALSSHGGRPADRLPRDVAVMPTGMVAPARGHHHVRGPLAADHAARARVGTAPCRRHRATSSGPRPIWSDGCRGGRGARPTRARTACAARARWRRAPRSTSCPTAATVTGTLRTFTEPQREEALGRLRVAVRRRRRRTRGVEVDLELPEHTPAVVNDAAVADAGGGARRKAVLGDDAGPAHAAGEPERRRERVPEPPARAATSSSAVRRPTDRAGRTTAPSFSVEDESLRVGANVLVRGAVALAAP